jgi:hypothetical protein
MGEVTKPMRDEAVRAGFWSSVGGRDYPRVQILTVAGLLAGTDAARFPLQDKASWLGYRARGQRRAGEQTALFTE